MKFYKVCVQGKKSFYLICTYLCFREKCNGIRSFFSENKIMYLNANLSKSFQKVFRENVNVLSSSSGKDNFYVFLLFLAVTNWQIIVITFFSVFLERFNIFRNTYFLFPNPLLCDAQG